MENKKKLLFFGGVRTMCLGLSCNFLVLCYAFFFGNKILFFTHASVCIGRKMGVFVGRYIMNWFSISVWLSQPAGTNQLSKDNEYINLKWNRLATTYSHTNNTHWHTLYDRSEAYKLSVFFSSLHSSSSACIYLIHSDISNATQHTNTIESTV